MRPICALTPKKGDYTVGNLAAARELIIDVMVTGRCIK